jgi:hypothetical protein
MTMSCLGMTVKLLQFAQCHDIQFVTNRHDCPEATFSFAHHYDSDIVIMLDDRTLHLKCLDPLDVVPMNRDETATVTVI